jgi:DNA mismatch endonuclease (patch repair protein)
MQAVRDKDTRPEWIVRRLLHGLGYRYRLHCNKLPGCPDLVFSRRHKVVFVHGCFWHGHECPRGARLPARNRDYWMKKLTGNKVRDLAQNAALTAAGWGVLVVWECETRNLSALAGRLQSFLE